MAFESKADDLTNTVNYLHAQKTPTNTPTSILTPQSLDTTTDMCVYEVDGAGLNLVSIASDVFHSHPQNKSLAKQFVGFPSWNETKLYIKTLFDVDYNTTICLRPNTKGLNEFEQLLVCFTWMMLGANYDLLGIMFGGAIRNYIGTIIHRWIDVIRKRGDMMSSLLPFLTEDSLEAKKPYTYNELNLDRIGGIVDGTD